jgi:hypothetical protein
MQECIAHDVDLSLPPAGEELWPDRTHAWRRLLVSLPPSCCSVDPVWAQQLPIPNTVVAPVGAGTRTGTGGIPAVAQGEDRTTVTAVAEIAAAATAQTVVATTA